MVSLKVAVVGSWHTGDFSVDCMVGKIPRGTTELISGGAPGVDTVAIQAALMMDLPIRFFSPDYEAYGKMAPLVRNRQIVDTADLVLAFWDCRSAENAYALKYCIKRHKPFRIFLFDPPGFDLPERFERSDLR